MSREAAFIARLRQFAHHPAARGLADDCAVLAIGDCDLVLTQDLLVEGVHYLPGDPPADVAWKLVAVNLSDLAAKGATPRGVLLGFPLGDGGWDEAFAAGLEAALAAYATPLLGGDTVRGTGPRQLALTALGTTAPGAAPSRAGARPGDLLCVTGTIGLAALGLAEARATPMAGMPASAALRAYRRPVPRLAEGRLLAPQVHAMCDVSDGLLLDAARLAAASGCAVEVDLAAVPCPPGSDRRAAASAGDDYELLFAWPPGPLPDLGATPVAAVGRFVAGAGLRLADGSAPPDRLGYEHG